jgi:hypothetical protein
MKNKNLIGLDTKKCKELADGLNELLANYQLFTLMPGAFIGTLPGKSFLSCTSSLRNYILMPYSKLMK